MTSLYITNHKEVLTQKILAKTAIVGVIGLGYVGLPFAVEKAKAGYHVIGMERNPNRVERVMQGNSYISDVDSLQLQKVVEQGLLEAVTDFSRVPELDAIIICVPTPLTKNLTPDLQYVEGVTEEIAKRMRPGQLICLESTTYPGTTEEVMLRILQQSGLTVDTDFFLAHSPERVDPGNVRFSTKNTNKVVGAVGPESLEVAEIFYKETVEQVITVSSAKAAELVKVFENTFRAVNIALVNELTLLCDQMQVSVWEVLDAAFTKPFGIMPFYPGPGVGGHCIPIDPHYLEWKAKEFQFNTQFISLAGEINRRMPLFVREKVMRILNQMGKAISQSRILIMGVAYKKDISDYRESPALEIIRLLHADGAQVSYHDPYVPYWEEGDTRYESVLLTDEILGVNDLVIIVTDHRCVDYQDLVARSRHVLDTRNCTKQTYEYRERITLL